MAHVNGTTLTESATNWAVPIDEPVIVEARKEAFNDAYIGTSPNAPHEVPALLEQIASYGTTFTVGQNEKVRADLLDTARSLIYALETPREAIIRHCWSQVR